MSNMECCHNISDNTLGSLWRFSKKQLFIAQNARIAYKYLRGRSAERPVFSS